MKHFLFSTLLLLILDAPVVAETVYKWVDDDGQVHYGRRTDDKDASKITIQETSEEKRQLKEKLKQLAEEEQRKKDEINERLQQRCQAARDQLKRVINSRPLYNLDGGENQVLLNKKQYDVALKLASARVKKWCKKSGE